MVHLDGNAAKKGRHYLAQYGVLGMKWGKRKSESQISRERKAKREAKAKKFDDRAEALNTRIKTLESATPKGYFANRTRINELKEIRKARDQAVKDAELKRQGKLSTTQKRVVIGAAVIGTIVAAKTIHDLTQSGEGRRLMTKGAAFMQGKKHLSFVKNAELATKDLDVDEIKDRVLKQINPDFGDIGTKMNCRRATFAYEMRRRGYDVMATRTTNAHGQNVAGFVNAIRPGEPLRPTSPAGVFSLLMGDLIKKEQGKPVSELTDLAKVVAGGKNVIEIASESSGAEDIFKALVGQPNGSRGEIAVQWGMGGGHSMAYEIVKGLPVIFDGQTGKTFASTAEAAKGGLDMVAKAGFTRLDNIPLNHDYLLRWIRNV